MISPRKRTDLSLKQKAEIIKLCEGPPKPSFSEVAKIFSVSPSTVSKIYKTQNTVLEQSSLSFERKHQRTSHAADVDEALFRWFCSVMGSNLPVSGEILKAKAEKFAVDLNIDDFKATNGWLDHWKKRYDVVFKRAHREKKDANVPSATNWIKNQLPAILQHYKPEEVYNADETGLCYRALPNGSHVFKQTAHFGGKVSKDCVALMVCASMTGEKRPLLFIGKSKNPRCLRRVHHLPISYVSSSNVWMTAFLFQEWLREWDKSLKAQHRRIALIVDNCPAHPTVKLNNIEMMFLPPNVTSLIQPCDQGIIRTLKAHYRRSIMSTLLATIDAADCELSADKLTKKIDILGAMLLVKEAWDSVTSGTIVNCFRKSGFLKDGVPNSEMEEEPVVAESLTEDEFNTFVNLDENAERTETLEDTQIVAAIQQRKENQLQAADSNDHDEGELLISCPPYKVVTLEKPSILPFRLATKKAIRYYL
ncbi:tigger transposable element-derived protein 4-like [Latimeria chalumnae]|uniref:tigger transposable element-derived protein 4-like n=1 Tax=Latimeria chalumnae TaxID=7897 RepID=UPI00313D2380